MIVKNNSCICSQDVSRDSNTFVFLSNPSRKNKILRREWNLFLRELISWYRVKNLNTVHFEIIDLEPCFGQFSKVFSFETLYEWRFNFQNSAVNEYPVIKHFDWWKPIKRLENFVKPWKITFSKWLPKNWHCFCFAFLSFFQNHQLGHVSKQTQFLPKK